MSDAATIATVFPRHPVKRLARLMGVRLGTAHDWLYRSLAASRRRELALALLDEMDRQDREERAAARRVLVEWADNGGMGEPGLGEGSALDRAAAALDRAARRAAVKAAE